jgi:LysM repeat protein
MAADQGWFAWLGPREFSFDMGLVNHERDKPLVPKPEFISKLTNKDGSEDLAFYRPSENEVFFMKNTGIDSYEVIKATVDWDDLTVQVKKADPPPPRWLTTHTVKPGESLSVISYKYYGSAKREFWQRIFDSNLDLLEKPSLINPGQQLRIPFKTGPLPEYDKAM